MIDLKGPLPWLLGSLAIAVIATNLTWYATRRLADRSSAGALPALSWLATSLFYLLPPVAAWRSGVLSPYWLGVAELDWVANLAAGALLAALIGGGLIFGWLVYRRSLPRDGAGSPRSRRTILTLRSLADAALLQWHWAFYRALAIGLLASGSADTQAAYWGVWLAMGAAAIEWALNPFARAELRLAGRREAALRQVALALATAALFVLTRNFYLGLALHLAVEFFVVGWFSLPATPASAETQPDRA